MSGATPLPPDSPKPVAYASPSDTEYLRWSASRVLPAVTWTVTVIVVIHIALVMVTPRVETLLIDFKIDLPVLSKLLIAVSYAYREGGWLITPPILIAVPFPWLGLATPRPRERVPRLVGSLVLSLLIAWLLLSLLLPLLTVYQTITGPGGK